MNSLALDQLIGLGFSSVLGFAAVGSALGTGAAGMGVIGAWKKCYAQNKTSPFILTVFAGAPLSQTIYGMIVMNALVRHSESGHGLWGAGIVTGIAMGYSAWMQGRAGAAAADALAETGKGFGNYLVILGIIETVALFVMVFVLMALRNI